MASTMTAPSRMNSVSLAGFRFSMDLPGRWTLENLSSKPDARAAAERSTRLRGRRLGGRGVPLRRRHDLFLCRISQVMRGHDLHAVLVENVLHVGVQSRQN